LVAVTFKAIAGQFRDKKTPAKFAGEKALRVSGF
jgi:hypothetical protein